MKKTIKTAIQAMGDIKASIVAANVPSETGLTGEIRTLTRRLNSKLEDIVINTVYFDAEQYQEGFFNVNIHVPNLINQPSGAPNQVDQTQPDIERMREIGDAVIAALDEVWLFDAHFSVDNAGEPVRDGTNWYLNIGIRYRAVRLDKVS